MRIFPPGNSADSVVHLSAVKAGRVVELTNPEGKVSYYMVCRSAASEPNIQAIEGKRLLVNLETGRAVMKHGHLEVKLLSCTARTYYHH